MILPIALLAALAALAARGTRRATRAGSQTSSSDTAVVKIGTVGNELNIVEPTFTTLAWRFTGTPFGDASLAYNGKPLIWIAVRRHNSSDTIALIGSRQLGGIAINPMPKIGDYYEPGLGLGLTPGDFASVARSDYPQDVREMQLSALFEPVSLADSFAKINLVRTY